MLSDLFDKLKQNVYNLPVNQHIWSKEMSISEQIKVLCVRSNISMAELARRLGMSPQSLNAKLKRESFTIADLETIADAVGASFTRKFVLYSGEEI